MRIPHIPRTFIRGLRLALAHQLYEVVGASKVDNVPDALLDGRVRAQQVGEPRDEPG